MTSRCSFFLYKTRFPVCHPTDRQSAADVVKSNIPVTVACDYRRDHSTGRERPFFVQRDDAQHPAHNLQPSLPRLPRDPEGCSEWLRLRCQNPFPSCPHHGHPVRSRRVSSRDPPTAHSLRKCRMLIAPQLEHPGTNDPSGDQGPRYESHEIRCVI